MNAFATLMSAASHSAKLRLVAAATFATASDHSAPVGVTIPLFLPSRGRAGVRVREGIAGMAGCQDATPLP